MISAIEYTKQTWMARISYPLSALEYHVQVCNNYLEYQVYSVIVIQCSRSLNCIDSRGVTKLEISNFHFCVHDAHACFSHAVSNWQC